MPDAPRLFLAVPTADGIAMTGFVQSLVATLAALHDAAIATDYASVDGTDIAPQRNELVCRFLKSRATHFLSLDSDMTFPSDLALRLLGFDKGVVGTIYTKRLLDLAALRRHLAVRPPREAYALAQDWNVRLESGGLRVADGLCRVAALPSGFILIRRDVFERLAARPGSDGPFDEMLADEEVLEGDYAFCRRVAAVGEPIWAYPAADIGHLGDWRGGGALRAALRPAVAAAEAARAEAAPVP